MKKLINDHKLPAIKNADTQISTLNNVVDTYKQSDEIRKLELQYRLSENYKLEIEVDKLRIEKDIKIKQIENDTQIAMGNIEIQLQREKNKQYAMEHGYDLTHFIDNVIKNKNNKHTKKQGVINL